MTGRELIIYILLNHLEDVEFNTTLDGQISPDFINEKEVASKFDVGIETVRTWYNLGMIKGYDIGGDIFYIRSVSDPRKEN